MANDPKSGHENSEERDPLSATAMFLRALEDPPPAKQEIAGHIAEKSVADSGSVLASRPSIPQSAIEPPKPVAAKAGAELGEFTQIFGKIRKEQISTDEAAAARAKTAQSASSPSSAISRPDESPGEFTRIFVKGAGAPATRADDRPQPKRSEAPGRAKGFSSPGISDAASADSTFAQFFKASSATEPRSSSSGNEPDNRELLGAGRDAVARSGEVPLRLSGNRSSNQGADHSVTELIAQLSSEKLASTNSKDAEVVPYREESRRPFTPEMRSSQPPEIDPGGVTQILQRLSSEPPKPIIEGPLPLRPEPAPKTGPGEFTRMVSRDEVNAAIGVPAAATPAQPAPAAPASPFTPMTPAIPQMRAPIVTAPPMPAAALAPAPPQFVAPAMPVMPAMPAATVPVSAKPAAATPAVAAPKSKLEAMVPFLLLVNTFLLVVLLVVVIFLIKTR